MKEWSQKNPSPDIFTIWTSIDKVTCSIHNGIFKSIVESRIKYILGWKQTSPTIFQVGYRPNLLYFRLDTVLTYYISGWIQTLPTIFQVGYRPNLLYFRLDTVLTYYISVGYRPNLLYFRLDTDLTYYISGWIQT